MNANLAALLARWLDAPGRALYRHYTASAGRT
jgi:hypothetical protein